MRQAFVVMALLLLPTTSFTQSNDAVVHWNTIFGVITAPGISNPVAGIASGGLPWTTTGGQATVNLATGAISFNVSGLVLNGGNASGTPDGIAKVKGTLVCNPGSATAQAVLDTATVPLSPQGDAQLQGSLGSVPSPCSNPLFLIRIPAGRWIATGAVRIMSPAQ
jgi:hypothetical protein